MAKQTTKTVEIQRSTLNIAVMLMTSSLLIVCIVAYAFAPSTPRQPEPIIVQLDQDPDSQALRARISQIDNELRTLVNHEWAGSYYQGDGMGANLQLRLSPKGGAVFLWSGCLGPYDQNYGPVEAADDQIRVTWKMSSDMHWQIPATHVAIRWGERRYLVAPEQILEFCKAVRLGEEPREGPHGRFFLRQGDEKIAVSNEPTLPADFEKYRKIGRINAKIKTLGEVIVGWPNQKQPLDDRSRQVESQFVTLDVGQVHGVLPKMRFRVTSLGSSARAEILKVSENESQAVITFSRAPDQTRTPPDLTWELSAPAW